eukprot:UC1_evm1s814
MAGFGKKCAVVADITATATTATSTKVTFEANLNTAKSSSEAFQPDTLTKCFGSSHASTALTTDWQRQLTKVRRDLGTEYVRFHGLLDDDMSVVLHEHPIRVDGIPTSGALNSHPDLRSVSPASATTTAALYEASKPSSNPAKKTACTFVKG